MMVDMQKREPSIENGVYRNLDVQLKRCRVLSEHRTGKKQLTVEDNLSP